MRILCIKFRTVPSCRKSCFSAAAATTGRRHADFLSSRRARTTRAGVGRQCAIARFASVLMPEEMRVFAANTSLSRRAANVHSYSNTSSSRSPSSSAKNGFSFRFADFVFFACAGSLRRRSRLLFEAERALGGFFGLSGLAVITAARCCASSCFLFSHPLRHEVSGADTPMHCWCSPCPPTPQLLEKSFARRCFRVQ